jgi:hypothetical protein
MKAAGLLFLMIACATWMEGTTYASPSPQAAVERPANENSAKPASDRVQNDRLPQDSRDAGTSAANGKFQGRKNESAEPPAPRPASVGNHARTCASSTTASRPRQLPNRWKGPSLRNATNLHQHGSGKSGLDKSGGAATGGFVQNRKVHNVLPVRSTSAVRPTVASLDQPLNPSLNNVRHRGPNPAVVGGSANFHNTNSGAIDGTRMHHKP